MKSLLLKSAAVIATALSASPAFSFEWGHHYAAVRGWDIYQTDYMCRATRPTGQMVDMTMEMVPVGNFELLFSSSLANDTEETVVLTIDGQSYVETGIAVDGWLHIVFDTPLREAMAAGSTMDALIGGMPITFQLDGATAAMLKMQECWFDAVKPDPNTSRALPVVLPSQAGGNKPGRAPASPSAAPAPANRTQTYYGEARGWTVQSETVGGVYAGCSMTRGPGVDLGLVRSEGVWFLRFPYAAADGTRIEADMDLDRASNNSELFVYDNLAQGPVDQSWVDGIGQGRHFLVALNGTQHQISLAGTAAAITKVEECDMNRGAAPTPVVENDAMRPGPNCPAMGTMRSPNLQDWGDITFNNRTDAAITLYWLDYNGMPKEMAGLLPGESIRFNSTAGHYWLARDFQGVCHGGTIEVAFGESYFDIR